jgi:AcrR family transcriptional regulator
VTDVSMTVVDGETIDFLLSQAMAPSALIDGLTAPRGELDPLERRLVEAMLECIGRWGVTKTTAEDIARAAGVSRATLYRAFPGGKDVALDALLRHEVGRFFDMMSPRLDGAETLEDLVTVGIVEAAGFIHGHTALGYLLEHEPGSVLPDSPLHLGRAYAVATLFTAPHLRRFVADDAAAAAGAEWVVRILFSYVMTPSASLDLTDEAAVRRFVRTNVLPALVASPDPS